jgi:hypothetical protein
VRPGWSLVGEDIPHINTDHVYLMQYLAVIALLAGSSHLVQRFFKKRFVQGFALAKGSRSRSPLSDTTRTIAGEFLGGRDFGPYAILAAG